MRKKIVWKEVKQIYGNNIDYGYIGKLKLFYVFYEVLVKENREKPYVLTSEYNLIKRQRFETEAQAKAKADEISDYIFNQMKESQN
jgi:hypothetical protein